MPGADAVEVGPNTLTPPDDVVTRGQGHPFNLGPEMRTLIADTACVCRHACRVLAAALLFVVTPAESLQLNPAGCESYALFVRSAAEVRDLGADLEKHQDLVEKKAAALPEDVRKFLRREVARIHASSEKPDDLSIATFRRCVVAQGVVDTGTDS